MPATKKTEALPTFVLTSCKLWFADFSKVNDIKSQLDTNTTTELITLQFWQRVSKSLIYNHSRFSEDLSSRSLNLKPCDFDLILTSLLLKCLNVILLTLTAVNTSLSFEVFQWFLKLILLNLYSFLILMISKEQKYCCISNLSFQC